MGNGQGRGGEAEEMRGCGRFKVALVDILRGVVSTS